MNSIKREEIDKIIKEEIDLYFLEHRGTPMKDRGIKGQRIAKQREDDNRLRTSKEAQYNDKVFAGKKELDSLGRGVSEVSDRDHEVLSKTQNELVKLHKEINKLSDLKKNLMRQVKTYRKKLIKIIKHKDYPTQEDLFQYCDKLNRTSKGKYQN